MEFQYIHLLMALVLGAAAISLFISILTNKNLKSWQEEDHEGDHSEELDIHHPTSLADEFEELNEREDLKNGDTAHQEAVFDYSKIHIGLN